MAKDYYAILGVDRDASPEQIKRAFRRLARETHPDANPGDSGTEERFREIAEAHEVLSDPQRRRAYDRGDTIDLSDLFAGFGGFDDLIRSVFGDSGMFGGGGRVRTKGRDVLTVVDVTLPEAAFGTDASVSFRTDVLCQTCGGNGAKEGTRPDTCPTCSGAGAVRVARRGLLGTVMSVATCDRCEGSGQIISDPCEWCGGAGVHPEDRTVEVEVPPGVSTGTRLRLNREGAAISGGQAGDLYVEIRVGHDDRWERHGDDVVHHVPVDMVDAALGTTVAVPLLEGGVDAVEIPAGSPPGWTTTLRGRGMGRLGRKGRGDMVVRLDVSVPTELSSDEAELLREFARRRQG